MRPLPSDKWLQEQSKSQLLVVKSEPYKFESLFGYLRRLARDNSYLTPYWLTKIEPVLKYRFPGYSTLITCALERLVGKDLSDFVSGVLLPRCIESKGRFYLYTKMRICPRCLKEGDYHQHVWEASYATACPYHRIALIDTCPVCGRPLRWDRLDITHCRCGGDLRKIRTKEASEAMLYYSTFIWRSMGHKVSEVNDDSLPAQYMKYFSSEELFAFMHCMYEVSCCKRSYKPESIECAVNRIDSIFNMLKNWPHNFKDTIDSFFTGRFNSKKIKEAYSNIYCLIYKINYSKMPFFVLNAFEEHIDENWIGVLDRRYSYLKSIENCKYVSLKSATKMLHISSNRMNKLIDLKYAFAERSIKITGRSFAIIKKCEVERLSEQIKHMITRYDVCNLLGISKQQLLELVGSKILNPHIKAGDLRFGTWWFDRRELDKFLASILQMMPKHAPADKAIKLKIVCQRHLTHRSFLPDLLRSVMRGEIAASGIHLSDDGSFKLSSMYFDLEQIRIFRKNKAKDQINGYTVPESAVILKIKQEVAYHLINNGFIESYNDPEWPKRGRIITDESISTFNNTYVSLTHVAKILKSCSRSAMVFLTKIGIMPVIGGNADTCRQVFYRWADLPEQYKYKNIDELADMEKIKDKVLGPEEIQKKTKELGAFLMHKWFFTI